MRQLVQYLSNQIRPRIIRSKTNIIRLENFDDPSVYWSLCKQFSKDNDIDTFIAKLTQQKYDFFCSQGKPEWQITLQLLHQGSNLVFSPLASSEEYVDSSYVDFGNAITKWRNEAANFADGKTSLVLLMGTELAPDTGGLADTSFVISPQNITAEIAKDYSIWFNSILIQNGLDSKDNQKAIHALYKTIFANTAIDIFKLSDFIDSLDNIIFDTMQELINYICETLNVTWGIPSIVDSKSVPKVGKLISGKMEEAKIITEAAKFIERADDTPTSRRLNAQYKQFTKYADENSIDIDLPFPSQSPIFSSFDKFKECYFEFIKGKNIAENRQRLLKIDFAIIAQILELKLDDPKISTEKKKAVRGDPLEAISRMVIESIHSFWDSEHSVPTTFSIKCVRISLSNYAESSDSGENDAKEKPYRAICSFLGGILGFLNDASIEYNGELLNFKYDGNDPFNFDYYSDMAGMIRCTGKWGDPCKAVLSITASNEIKSKHYEYRWAFSPYTAWSKAFDYLGTVVNDPSRNDKNLPTLVVCNNIPDYLNCESEEDFYSQFEQLQETVLYDEHQRQLAKYFKSTDTWKYYCSLCDYFVKFAEKIDSNGLFNAMEDLRCVVKSYSDLMKNIHDSFYTYTDVQRSKLPLLVNCFTITSNANVLTDGKMGEVILPAYHPVVLEEIDAQQLFLRNGIADILTTLLNGKKAAKDFNLAEKTLDKYVELSMLTQGADTILSETHTYLPCRQMWGYFGVYFSAHNRRELLSGNTYGMSIVTDDEDAKVLLRATPISNIVKRNVIDYINTFPSRCDGLNIAFVAPSDMQHIVSAIHAILTEIEKESISATINLNIFCINSSKNSSAYLRRWLDSYFSDERSVRVNTFLHNITVKSNDDVFPFREMLEGQDLCFTYDILNATRIDFSPGNDTLFDTDALKFPMTFTPDAVSTTSGKIRKKSLSHFQFLSSKFLTQANYIIGHPNSKPGTYRTFQELELRDIQERIIDIAHEMGKWVVCIDPAIDRKLLEAKGSKIIGFTTGEGSYGELNVTVSARKDILADIKELLRKRLMEKFTSWDSIRLKTAVDYCIDTLSEYIDGSKILKALNPYDYEIHSFLANLLTTEVLGLTKPTSSFVIRELVSLDSYQHWFEGEGDNKRPDFMLVEIPKNAHNLDCNSNLQINIKIIECKMGFYTNAQIDKAKAQLEQGLTVLTKHWRPKSSDPMHRYWLNQLYRAIIFAPVLLDNSSEDYQTIREKIFAILNGDYEINWSADVYAYWLDVDTENVDEWEIQSFVVDELCQNGIVVDSIKCHSCGQLFIQKMLLPPIDRASEFDFIEQESVTEEEQYFDEEDPTSEEVSVEVEIDTPVIASSQPGASIPSQSEVNVPFLTLLHDGKEHSRKSSLEWFSKYFKITNEDKALLFESNKHSKWETALDTVISKFRSNGLLENSQYASFHITPLGNTLFDAIASKSNCKIDFYAVLSSLNTPKPDSTASRGQLQTPPPMEDHPLSTQDTISPVLVPETKKNKKKALKDIRLLLGENQRTHEKYYWEFGNPDLNNRHLLINGNSGCGKTYCIQALLMESALQGISSVVFDYTGGFANSKLDPVFKMSLEGHYNQRIVKKDKIPINPFQRHEIQIDDDIVLPEEDADVADKIAEIFKSVYKLGDQQRSSVYSAVLSGLKTHGDNMSFPIMVSELEKLNAKSVLSKIQTFADFNPFSSDDDFNWSNIRDSEGMVYVIQLAGYGREIQVLLTELLLWDIWSFCVKNGDESKPFVLVLDEAQNLSHGEKSPSAKILTEGRKFGLSGWYATQFMKPQLTDDEIQRLQQAGKKLYFCPPDEGVMTVAKNIDISAAGAKEWSERLTKLKKGECVTCGNMVRNEKWVKYTPSIIKITSLQERVSHGNTLTNQVP